MGEDLKKAGCWECTDEGKKVVRYSGKKAIRLCWPFPFLHFSFMAKRVVYHLSTQNQPTVYWLIFTALTANTFFWFNCRFFLDSYFVVGFAGFCLVMVFYYLPESTTQRNRDQSDSFYFIFFGGGRWAGKGFVCFTSCSAFLWILCDDNILLLTTIYQMEDPQ